MRLLCDIADGHWRASGKKPLFCYDNAAIQVGAHYQRMGFAYHQRVVIPTHSPDFNKPIEHVFHQIKDRLMERLYECAQPVTAQLVQDWILDIWASDISTDSIAADAKSLKKTYLAVKTDKGVEVEHDDTTKVIGSGGDFAAASVS